MRSHENATPIREEKIPFICGPGVSTPSVYRRVCVVWTRTVFCVRLVDSRESKRSERDTS